MPPEILHEIPEDAYSGFLYFIYQGFVYYYCSPITNGENGLYYRSKGVN